MEEKKRIRTKIQKKRMEMSPDEWTEKTARIFCNTVCHPLFQRAKTIYCYVDFRREAGTEEIMREAWKLGKKVAVPRTEGKEMDFYYIESLQELSVGHFGVREPKPSALADGTEGLVIMPGTAFDRKCHRIGYGMGYYDRYLREHPSLDTMALAFSFQVLEQIPSEPFDINPGVIITEDGMIETAVD